MRDKTVGLRPMPDRHGMSPIAGPTVPSEIMLGSEDPRIGKIDRVLRQAVQVLHSEGISAALTCLNGAPLVNPDRLRPLTDAERIALLGQFLLRRDPKTALQLARHGLTLDDTVADVWQLTGNALEKLGAPEARQVFVHLLNLSGARPEHVLNAAMAIARIDKLNSTEWSAALQAFNALGKPLAKIGQLLYLAQKVADWSLLNELTERLQAVYAQGRFDEVPEAPRSHINWCADERWNLEVIQRWNRRNFPQITSHSPKPQALPGRRMKVGYLSSDFREHPTSRLANGLFRHHDRSRVELFMYCSGWDDGSALRREVVSHFDHVHSVTRLSDEAAAALIRSHQIDVLVELNGPTWANRMDILAHRPAPVQIGYLGWPASVGGRVVDAIVADRYLVPPEHESLYSEKIIYLHNTYQVNDYAARHRPARPSRAAVGLQEGPWQILGAFNGIEKLHGAVWQAWMAILKAAPNALLWLLDPGELAKRHIAQVTSSMGVDGRRIVIAPRIHQPSHLARLQLCDLMLDPWPYGGHTTTSDALFCGVPVLALEGTNFASRVSGSLLNAAGLGELITQDTDSYVDLATRLLQHPEELKRIKTHIAELVPAMDIFNAKTKARQLEDAYLSAVESVCEKNL